MKLTDTQKKALNQKIQELYDIASSHEYEDVAIIISTNFSGKGDDILVGSSLNVSNVLTNFLVENDDELIRVSILGYIANCGLVDHFIDALTRFKSSGLC